MRKYSNIKTQCIYTKRYVEYRLKTRYTYSVYILLQIKNENSQKYVFDVNRYRTFWSPDGFRFRYVHPIYDTDVYLHICYFSVKSARKDYYCCYLLNCWNIYIAWGVQKKRASNSIKSIWFQYFTRFGHRSSSSAIQWNRTFSAEITSKIVDIFPWDICTKSKCGDSIRIKHTSAYFYTVHLTCAFGDLWR